MKNYVEALKELYALARFRKMKLGLEHTEQLSNACGHSHAHYKTIQVAGTNGKGSTALKIAQALQLAGYRVGLYTSPHINSFRERIQVNREWITEEAVIEGLSELLPLAERLGIKPTFFEIGTQLALNYFKDQKVDAAVLETGLGGRLDSTNIVMPVLSVITSISFDHTAILGNTLEAIAEEKAGIIKKNVPVVLGPKAGQIAIQKKAFELKCPITFVPEISQSYEIINRMISKAGLRALRTEFPSLTEEIIDAALQHVPQCRFEQLLSHWGKKKNIPAFPEAVILDVAHNPDGLQALFRRVAISYPHRKIYALAAFSNDKDLGGCLKVLCHYAKVIYVTEVNNPRIAKKADLLQLLQKISIGKVFITEAEEGPFFELLSEVEREQAVLVICGSFYLMPVVRKLLRFEEVRDPIDVNEGLYSLETSPKT